jgi:hypothetical protein
MLCRYITRNLTNSESSSTSFRQRSNSNKIEIVGWEIRWRHCSGQSKHLRKWIHMRKRILKSFKKN